MTFGVFPFWAESAAVGAGSGSSPAPTAATNRSEVLHWVFRIGAATGRRTTSPRSATGLGLSVDKKRFRDVSSGLCAETCCDPTELRRQEP